MKKPIIIANWKMNPETQKEVKKIISFSDKENVIVCPPFVFLKEVKEKLKKAKIGAQNCFYEKKGAFTGEVSSSMLKTVGCKYVILGHSERRSFFNEDNKTIKRKIEEVLLLGLVPVVCIGEKKQEKNDKIAEKYIKKQIEESLSGISLKNVFIAYEPIFAIGTGNSCSPSVAEKRRLFIKNEVVEKYQDGEKTKIFYGGSVNSKNASSYIKEAFFDGLLVGGASLKKDEFKGILESF